MYTEYSFFNLHDNSYAKNPKDTSCLIIAFSLPDMHLIINLCYITYYH